MIEKVYETQCGKIHYWINKDAENTGYQLVFLPGLTADHRLFDRQAEQKTMQDRVSATIKPGINRPGSHCTGSKRQGIIQIRTNLRRSIS